jgi:hypothetical protein
MTVNDDLSVCPRCGKQFHCSKSGKCWCYEVHLPLDALEFIEANYDRCLCPSCLNEFSRPKRGPDGKISLESLIRLPLKNK